MSELRIYELVMTMDPVDVVKTFAQELSVDPTVQTSICAELSTRHPETKSGSHQEELTAQMLDILVEEINLEVVVLPVDKNNFKFQIYFFGTERPLFSFSIACLQTNPTLTACLYRMMSDGREGTGSHFFRGISMPADKSRSKYDNFLYNDVLARHFFRVTLVLHLVMAVISGIDLYFAERYPNIEIARRGAELLQRVVADLDSRLTQVVHQTDKRPAWVTQKTCTVINQLRDIQKTPFEVKKLFSATIAKHIESYSSTK